MTALATLNPTCTGSPLAWADVTFALGTVANGNSTFTLTAPTGASPNNYFNNGYPVGVMVLSQSSIQGATNNGSSAVMPAGVGVAGITVSGNTITVAMVNNTGSGQTVPSARWLFFQVQGI